MTTDTTSISRRLMASCRANRPSVLLFVGLGVVAGLLLGYRQLSGSEAQVDIVASPVRLQLTSSSLDPGAARGFEPQAEVYYINHAYDEVSATLVGPAIVVSANGSSDESALEELQTFLKDYLALRSADDVAVFDSAATRSQGLAAAYQAEVERIDQLLVDGGLSEASRSELAVQRSGFAVLVARHQADETVFRELSNGTGQFSIAKAPHIVDQPLRSQLMSPILAVLLLSLLGVAQAFFRFGARESLDR